MCPVKTI